MGDVLKLVLLGDTGVGKTCLLSKWTRSVFHLDEPPTVGGAFLQHDFPYNGDTYRLQIWDTAGQERYHSMAPVYSQGAAGVMLVFDLTRRESLEHLATWRGCLDDATSAVLAVGNKLDLEAERQVQWAEGVACAGAMGCEYIEASARSGDGVDAAFERLAALAVAVKTERLQEKIAVVIERKSAEEDGKCC
jgi:small GTP-binding protein